MIVQGAGGSIVNTASVGGRLDIKIEAKLLTIKVLVGERGFEPPTPWSRTRCSTRLSHSPNLRLVSMFTTERLLADPLVQRRKLPQSVTEARRAPGIPAPVNCEEVFQAAAPK
jgi:hypothetical protein